MASKAAIFNMALTLLGQDPISDPDGTGTAETACRQVYDICRKALLEQHPWNFALTRANLDKESTNPAFEYSSAFGLPTDCLRIVQVYSPASYYKEEAGLILSDDTTMKLVYVKDEQDTSVFPPLFVQMLATDIALLAEYKITNQASMQQMLTMKRQELLIKAKMVDAQKDSVKKKFNNAIVNSKEFPYGDM
jgi:hypothetical protein